ncbi:hypothetical protein Tco_1362853 [Tanacetum coccineum]
MGSAISNDSTRGTESGEERFKKFANNPGVVGGERFRFNPFSQHAVKAGDGTILATSPPYTRFLDTGIDFAVVSPGMPHVDMWVQEFLRHEIPCVSTDYLVEFKVGPNEGKTRIIEPVSTF